jgi:hypothetical protein
MAILALACLLVGGVGSASAGQELGQELTTLDVRVWQHLAVHDRIYVTALPKERSGRPRPPVRVRLDDGASDDGRYRFGVVAGAEVELRVWQHVDEPSDIRISARPTGAAFDTLGPIIVLLDDGVSSGGGYRYGQMRIVVPPGETRVVSVSPSGDEVPRLAVLTVKFRQAASEFEPAENVAIAPTIEGSFAWAGERTLLFQPAYPGWRAGQRYVVTISGDAAEELADHVHTFTAGGRLTVVHVIPADGDIEVPTNAQILVQFNRSVAPLTILQGTTGRSVLEFNPPLAGQGEWLNTSLYRFVPSDLRRHTEYSVRIPAGLTATTDGLLESDFGWSFSTVQPAVTSIAPHDGAESVEVDMALEIGFNEPMDHSSVEAGLTLRSADGTEIGGSFGWSDDSRTVSFKPQAALMLDTRYEIVVAAGLKSASGGVSRNEHGASFTTIAAPRLRNTDPSDGDTDESTYGFSLWYSNPMDIESFAGRISISGIDPEDIKLPEYVEQGSTYLPYWVPLEYSTTYTVRLAAGVRDLGGRPLPAYEFTFTTRDPRFPPYLNLSVPARFSIFSTGRMQELRYRIKNAGEVRFQLFRLADSEAERLLRQGVIYDPWANVPFWPTGDPLREWTEPIDSDQRPEKRVYSTALGAVEPLPSGHYFLVATPGQILVDGDPEDYRRSFVFSVVDAVIVTKLAHDELVVWAVDYDTGEPLGATPVRAAPMQKVPSAQYVHASTDDDGVARLAVSGGEGAYWDAYGHYLVRIDAERRHGVTSTWWNFGTRPRDVDVPTHSYEAGLQAQIYTDRPIYRPGETVFYRAVVRHDNDARYSVPPADLRFTLQLRGPGYRSEAIARIEQIELSELGATAGGIELPPEMATGSYTLSVRDQSGDGLAEAEVIVAEFRAPEFAVEMAVARSDYVAGETIGAEARASFYFGAPVNDAELTWTARAWPTVFRAKGYEGYSFRDAELSYRPTSYRGRAQGEGENRTDAFGLAPFDVAAELQSNDSTHEFTISATVTDANGRAVAESATVLVHPAAWYVGIKPESYLATAGQPASAQLVTVDVEGRISPNRAVTVRVYEREWVRTTELFSFLGRGYLSEPVDTEVDVQTVNTDVNGEATVKYTPAAAGTYRLVAESLDDEGRLARSARTVWASGTGHVRWPVRDNDMIELIADRESYEVGDVAEVLVPAPFAGATGLITIERGRVLSSEVRRFETTSEVLQIPIEDHYVPDVYVGVVLYRPPSSDDPHPRYHVGYARLQISTEPRRLNVSIQSDGQTAGPGETVQYEVQVKDAEGLGVEADLSVAIVDQAVLSLLDESGLDGIGAFWSERPLGVRTASSLSVAVGRREADIWASYRMSPLVNDEEVSYPATGGGDAMLADDPGLGEDPSLRSDFRHTALWIGQLATDASGRAAFELKLPHNTTTWNARGRAVTATTQVGEGESDLLVSKPLLVRPALPRFLRVGDKVKLRVLVTSRYALSSEVTVTIETQGLELENTDARDVELGPGETEALTWSAWALEQGEATIRFIATVPGREGDSVEHKIAVQPAVTPETTATGGVVVDSPVIEALYLPDYAITDGGSLELSLQASLVGPLDAELEHFRPRPRESYVRVASRLVASIAVWRANASGLTEAQRSQIDRDVSILLRGGRYGRWAWCQSCPPTGMWVTGWAMIALGEVAKAGYAVPEEWLERAEQNVAAQLDRDNDVSKPPNPDLHAFLLYALASVARDRTEVAEQYVDAMHALVTEHRSRLSSWARAYLLLGLTAAGVEQSHNSVRMLINDLSAASTASANGNHWQAPHARGTMHSGTVRATALVLRSLATVDPRHPLIEKTVRWLVLARSQDHWKTSVERSESMAALSVFAQITGEGRGVDDYQVLLNTQRLLGGRFDAPAGDDRDATTVGLDLIPKGEVSLLQFDRDGNSEGRMYYTLNLRYLTPATEIAALNRGFAVSRRFSLLDDPDTAITGASLGDVVRVEVTVVAPAERRFARVEDFLPAGLEAIDPQLNIVSPWLREQLRTEQRDALLEGAPSYVAPWFSWYLSPWNQVDLRDDRITLLAGRLLSGVYRYVYYARATTSGDFFVPPVRAEETYFPEVFGRSDSGRFQVFASE